MDLAEKLQEIQELSYKFDFIWGEINSQQLFIKSKFNVKPQYVLLGIKAADIIQHNVGVTVLSNRYSTLIGGCKAYFNLVPIVDSTLPLKLPEHFVQVVIPLEVLGM